MELGLKGRVAIVTGGSKGIGRAIAISLAREGAHVAICARGAESLAEVQKEIQQFGGRIVAVRTNVTAPDDVQRVVQAVGEQFGRIDIVVNNAGGATKFAGFLELTDDDWHGAFDLNVMSVVYFTRYALPWLRQSPAARIINISSISGIEPGFYNPHYTVTKAATINLSKYLANQLTPDGVLVNVVCPGPVYSDSWDRNVQRIADMRDIPLHEARELVNKEEELKIPLGRIGTGNDVAALATFLASDQADWITGSCFHVNGGKLRSMC